MKKTKEETNFSFLLKSKVNDSSLADLLFTFFEKRQFEEEDRLFSKILRLLRELE